MIVDDSDDDPPIVYAMPNILFLIANKIRTNATPNKVAMKKPMYVHKPTLG
jgi:hypothetical protein